MRCGRGTARAPGSRRLLSTPARAAVYKPERSMAEFLQQLVNGLSLGSIYALIALGYTMVYGILKFINFAHSDVFTLGAWVSLAAATSAGFGAGGEPAPITPWVHGIAVGLVVAAVALQVYERLLRGRLPAGVVRW